MATVAMSVVMVLGSTTGVSPMPKPIPVALLAHTLGGLPMPTLLGLALVTHSAYGALTGAVLAALAGRVTVSSP